MMPTSDLTLKQIYNEPFWRFDLKRWTYISKYYLQYLDDLTFFIILLFWPFFPFFFFLYSHWSKYRRRPFHSQLTISTNQRSVLLVWNCADQSEAWTNNHRVRVTRLMLKKHEKFHHPVKICDTFFLQYVYKYKWSETRRILCEYSVINVCAVRSVKTKKSGMNWRNV